MYQNAVKEYTCVVELYSLGILLTQKIYWYSTMNLYAYT